MDTNSKIDATTQGEVDIKAQNEARIAELEASIAKRSKILTMLQNMPEEDKDATAISETEKAVDKMRSEIAKIQFGSISNAVLAQGEAIAQKLQDSLSKVITLGANQAAVITISVLGTAKEDGKGYDVKFRLTTAGSESKTEGEATSTGGGAKGKALVYNGTTFESAAKTAKAVHEAQGKKFPEGSVNWLKWIKTHNKKDNLGITYAETGLPVE